MVRRVTASRNILLIEDEPLIAMMLEDVLDTLGHSVVGTADTVSEAMTLVERGGFDFAILDVNLRGGEASWPVADVLAARGTPYVLASGGGTAETPERHRGAPALAKPFTLADVERVVGEG